MIDVIGAISLTGIFALFCSILITSSPIAAASRSSLAAAAVIWFACIASLAASQHVRVCQQQAPGPSR